MSRYQNNEILVLKRRYMMTKAIVVKPQVVLNHFELVVQPDELNTAVELFVQLFGWMEVCERAVSGEWGKSRFVKPALNDALLVQLSDYVMPAKDMTGWPVFNGHLALGTQKSLEIVETIQGWAGSKGFRVELEDVGEGKWFITIYGLFAQQLEIVPI